MKTARTMLTYNVYRDPSPVYWMNRLLDVLARLVRGATGIAPETVKSRCDFARSERRRFVDRQRAATRSSAELFTEIIAATIGEVLERGRRIVPGLINPRTRRVARSRRP